MFLLTLSMKLLFAFGREHFIVNIILICVYALTTKHSFQILKTIAFRYCIENSISQNGGSIACIRILFVLIKYAYSLVPLSAYLFWFSWRYIQESTFLKALKLISMHKMITSVDLPTICLNLSSYIIFLHRAGIIWSHIYAWSNFWLWNWSRS